MLTLSADINAGVKKRPQQPAVAQQQTQQLIVIDVDIVKSGGVKQIVAVNKNGDAATMSKLPRRSCSRVKLHFVLPQTTSILRQIPDMDND